MSKIAVQVVKLSSGYGHKIVIQDVEFTLPEGTFLAVVGPNGSGKSTLLKTLANLLAPLSGAVYIDGRELRQYSRHELARKLAIVTTLRVEARFVKVLDILIASRLPYMDIFGRVREVDIKRVQEALRLVGAEHLADRYFDELSDGEKQKILIARALAQEPKVLILDEPTSHLDVKNRLEIMHLLYKISRERKVTVIASLHDIDLIPKFCDYVLIMKDGKVVAFGRPEEVLTRELLTQVYDLEKISMCDVTTTFELRVSSDSRIFVIAGYGTGVRVYRMLARESIGFTTGILLTNDIDYHVATTLGAQVIAVDDIIEQERAIEQALRHIEKAEIVIDAGFPITGITRVNLKLLEYAIEIGKKVLTLRENPLIQGVIRCRLGELMDRLRAVLT